MIFLMQIKKSYLKGIFFTLLSIILIISVGLGIIYFQINQKTGFKCTEFSKLFSNSDCGLIFTTEDQSFSSVLGIVKNKYEKNNSYFIELNTKDINNSLHIETIKLNKPKTSLTKNTYTESTKKLASNSFPIDDKALFEMVNKDDQIMISVFINSGSELSNRVMNNQKDPNFKKCVSYHKLFIDYLKNPTLVTYLQLKFNELKNKCDITALQIQIFEK